MSSYTVEQVELMRRLRLTGISAQQIIDAFDTLERLERDLAPYQNHVPMADCLNGGPLRAEFTPPQTLFGANHLAAINTFASPYDSLLNRFQRQSGAPSVSHNHIVGSNGHGSRRKRSIPNNQFPNLDHSNHEENGLLADQNNVCEESKEQSDDVPAWTVNQEEVEAEAESLISEDYSFPSMPELELLEPDRSLSQERPSLSATQPRRRRADFQQRRGEPRPRPRPRPVVAPMNIDYSQLVDDQQLDEFASRGELVALKEIKEFVAARQLRQQTIAVMTGVSQPYVSRFLSGIGKELSNRVRRNMYRWYLALKNNPDMPIPTSAPVAAEDPGPPTMVSINGNSIFPSMETLQQAHHRQSPFSSPIFTSANGSMIRHPSQSSSPAKDIKRERFIFKPVHVRLLHKYFNQDPYPSIKKREEIAAACNKAYESMAGGKYVPPRDFVSSQVIGNWFSNRRKEKKRRGEMKLRRIRGGPRFGGIHRAVHNQPSGTAHYHIKESTSNGLILSNIFADTSKGETSHHSESPVRRDRTDLANIVNGLHAMNHSGLSLADSYHGEISTAGTI